ncbi:MAG: carbon-nitrogen hydrolase family protein, partial [Planctomycetes bacterium]|nr:carbon-nitrogen hydrolase family protein [Planctomycetota bacterium]
KRYRQWVLLGSTHRLSGKNKPHNSVYVINAKGEIVERYDKRFCTGLDGKRPTMDLHHYSPGNRAVTFKVKGITCGVLICYDYRFPELYRELKKLGVRVLFQSFHNARKTVVDDESYDIWRTIVPATMSCRAAENHIWVSANNSTTRPSRWGSFIVQPDGAIIGKLRNHVPGVLITDMPLDPKFFDAPRPWRESAMNGQLHSGKLVQDPRSKDVTCL